MIIYQLFHRQWSELHSRIGITSIAIIFIYFSISISNIILKNEVEWFPFFSFKLYSRIPNGFERYDLLLNSGMADEHFLLQDNERLNDLEKKHVQHHLAAAARAYQSSRALDFTNIEDLFVGATTVSLVKIEGDYVEAVKNGHYETTILQSIR